jgi:hypothetical protein
MGLLDDAGLDDAFITKALKEKFKVTEDIPYLKPTSWMRSSKFPTICPREEVICTRIKKERTWAISTDLKLIFEHGHGLHARLQDHILPEVGMLQGKWICNGCGLLQGGPVPDDDSPVESWAIDRPENCEECYATDFRYHEVKFYDEEHRISGHCDGFLNIPPLPGLGILEGKSIGPGWQIQNVPKMEHVIQVQTYMWLTGLQWGIILYWIKGNPGMSGIVEHFVERDENSIDAVKANLRSIWDGVDGGPMPGRICPKKDCPRAKKCSVSKECFSEDHNEF